MSGHYSLKSFLRKAQNKDLERYFKDFDIKAELDWGSLKETKIDLVADSIENQDDKIRMKIESDFISIDLLNNAAGYQALRQELGHDKNHVLDNLDFINAAFLCFFDHKDSFDSARVFQPFFDKGRYWRKIHGLFGKLPENPIAQTKELAKNISQHFKNNEGRGRNCQVEYYKRDGRHFFFAFPEDHPMPLIQWVQSEIQKSHVNPAFEIVFVYDEDDRSLDTHYEGSFQNAKLLDNVFAQAILGKDIPESLYNKPVYALDKLKSRDFRFLTLPQDGIERITITKMKFASFVSRKSKVTLESDVFGHKGQDVLYQDMSVLFAQTSRKFPLEMMQTVWVEIAVDFRSEGRKGYKRRRFTISAPNSCTLKHDGEDLIVRRILKDSGIELSNKDTMAGNGADRQVA